MKLLVKLFLVIISLAFLVYLSLPNPEFPNPPEGALQSNEPADTETPLRRAYFTDFTRGEVLDFYQRQFSKSPFLNIPLLTYRLNYPPEDSQTLIRDQTRSTFLEEIVHPFRESIFVNGFEPHVAKDEIWYKGIHYRQKIIIKYVPSNTFVRVFISILTLSLVWVVVNELKSTLKWTSR